MVCPGTRSFGPDICVFEVLFIVIGRFWGPDIPFSAQPSGQLGCSLKRGIAAKRFLQVFRHVHNRRKKLSPAVGKSRVRDCRSSHQEERREVWKRHHALEKERPLILIFPEGSWRALLSEDQWVCQDPFLRSLERQLKIKIYTHEKFDTDYVVEKTLNVSKHIGHTGWGLEIQHNESEDPTGAWGFTPTMKTYEDAKKLVHPERTVDEKKANDQLNLARDIFGDILTVRQKGITHNACHLTLLFSGWRGLQQICMDMIEAPNWVHEVMAFISEGLVNLWQQYEAHNLLSINNEDDYHSSGGIGYSDELPALGFDPDYVRLCDVWGSAESQEMTMVSPQMHEELVMKYEAEFLKPFGLNGYGCSDDLTRKLDTVCTLPQMRRVSVSPYADVQKSAQRLGGDFILSWKSDPRDIAGGFYPETVRTRIRSALQAARDNGCAFEMILKDTHTCDKRPERFAQWSKIAREEVNRAQTSSDA